MIYLFVILPRRGQKRRSRWPLVSPRAAHCLRRLEPIVPEVEWNREAAGSVRTHTVFTIGKHTHIHKTNTHNMTSSSLIRPHLFPGAADKLRSAVWEKHGLCCSAKLLFRNAHLPPVGHRDTQVHSFISPHFKYYKHEKDVHCVLDSLHAPQ